MSEPLSAKPISEKAALDLVRVIEHLVEREAPKVLRAKPSIAQRIWRESDRLLTPFSFAMLVIVLGEIVAVTLLLCYHSYTEGKSYEWIVDDATKLVIAGATLITAVLSVGGKHQTSRIERKVTGVEPTPVRPISDIPVNGFRG